MSQNSTARPLSKFNLVLALLWLVDVVVTGVGYWVLTSSNATQADFYTSQSADYVRYFSAQSGSNLGATLIGVGLTGFIITLAAMVVARSISKNVALAAPAVDNGPDFDFDDDTDFHTDEKAAVREHAAAETGSIKTVTAHTVEPTPAAAPPVAAPAAETPAVDSTTDDEPTDEPKTAR